MRQLLRLQSSFHLESKNLSSKPGIYIFSGNNSEVLYIGKAKNLKNRISSYFANKNFLDTKTSLMVSQIKAIKTIEVENEIESFLLEASYIKSLTPKYNIKLKDAKTYPMIRISILNRYPSITVVRSTNDSKSLYFGPFPKASELRSVLKIIRRIFPYVSVINHPKKVCFYNHINLCPCPQAFEKEDSGNPYKKTVKHIISFLSGNTKKLIKDLIRERGKLSDLEEFENAELVQKKIDAITNIASSFHSSLDYEKNPNLTEDLRQIELCELSNILLKREIVVNDLNKIECYDISNISGKFATGSMIVFIKGERDPSLYRKFRIKLRGPNDPGMMHEVITRRLKHSEWDYPDLIIVDGGRSQVSFAKRAIEASDLKIPLIGLAKRNETIITIDLNEISLPKDSKALLLLQRVRDEAHRFAISYHKKLRSKFIF